MRWPVLIFVLLLGILFGSIVSQMGRIPPPFLNLRGSCDNLYRLINPWIRCEPEQNISKKKEFTELRNRLVQSIDRWKKSGTATHVSVYVRDLEYGPWMGIEEEEIYSPASILKVPLMLAILRQSERKPELLQANIRIAEHVSLVQKIQPRNPVQPGKTYTVKEILEHMIVSSDNVAKDALAAYLDYNNPGEDMVYGTLSEMGLVSGQVTTQNSLTVRQIASMFRILYNASYMGKDASEFALELLSMTDFHDGIVAGVPDNITIAHKFGERTFEDRKESQLHDCGIVYYPKNHYLICVMTKGPEMESLSPVIADLSRQVYEEMHARYP